MWKHSTQPAQLVSLVSLSFYLLGVAFFAYESVGIFIPVASKMRNPAKMEKVLFYSFTTCVVLYILMGLIPYLAFGEDGLILPFVT